MASEPTEASKEEAIADAPPPFFVPVHAVICVTIVGVPRTTQIQYAHRLQEKKSRLQ